MNVSSPLEQLLQSFAVATVSDRRAFLEAVVRQCNVRELSELEALLLPRLKVDFLHRLPMEVALHVLTFLDDPRSLANTAAVSRAWYRLSTDEYIWGLMCVRHAFHTPQRLRWMTTSLLTPSAWSDADGIAHMDMCANGHHTSNGNHASATKRHDVSAMDVDEGGSRLRRRRSFFADVGAMPPPASAASVSLREYFRLAYMVQQEWLRGGRVLRTYETTELADADPDPNRRLALTCCAMDEEWIIAGMTNSTIFVFSSRTGKLERVLRGHESGVWCLMLATGTHDAAGADAVPLPPTPAADDGRDELVCTHADRRPSMYLSLEQHGGLAIHDAAYVAQQSADTDVACARTKGWGQRGTRLVSAGSDRSLRVWNVHTGECENVLRGHTSTIRCVHVVAGQPVAVTGSRDGTLRVWDLELGQIRHVLAGHQHSVRCLAVQGNVVASGSYDFTCRLWDWTTGRCLHVLKGHQLQIYAIAFDGVYVATGSSDSTVRVWDAATGAALAVFHGYTHVVAQIQLDRNMLATGSSDGRVIVYSLATMECMYRIVAHESGVTTLQMNERYLVTGGSDGLVKLWDAQSGRYIRTLCEPCEAIWCVRFMDDICVVLGKRHGRCAVDVVSFRPPALYKSTQMGEQQLGG